MAAIDLRSMFSRCHTQAREALEGAAGLALSRTHYNIEIEHWLLKLLEDSGNDIGLILRQYDIDSGKVEADLNRSLDQIKTGNGRAPALSPNLVKLVKEAWLLASLKFGESEITSGHLICALVSDDDLRVTLGQMSSHLVSIQAITLIDDFPKIIGASSEKRGTPVEASGGGVPAAAPGSPGRAGGALEKYTIDVTAAAERGEIDTIVGRDAEIRQLIDILTRRRQNNPILTGEAGVGKTAAVEGFALKLAAGDVPDILKSVRLRSLDLGLLQAGAGMKGEFENRLKSVIREVKDSPQPIIMFIDEAHTLIGAGGAEGQGDAANLLKPALARGEMRTIAATTWAEYKKYFEKDPALTRRFQVVKIEEPSEEVAILMMRGMVPALEKHHGVTILDEAVTASVHLSHRYIPGRQLPDKSISLLDTACARVGVSQASTPGVLEDAQRTANLLEVEISILEREAATGVDHTARLAESKGRLELKREELKTLSDRMSQEKDLVSRLATSRVALTERGADTDTVKAALAADTAALKALQGEAPLVFDLVDRDAVADIVAGWTGIPVGRMGGDEIRGVLGLEPRLGERIKGQDFALKAVAEAIQISRAQLTDPRKPVGVFMMCGTSGVGKTETALALADLVYGGPQSVTVINMSEFKEEHKVSMLVGSPPGYVGYGEGGVLTEAVRRKPYSIVLLDEMEKAHPGVQDIFFQVFDKGMLKDGQGRDIDFKNTIIIMTSNAGTETIEKLAQDPDTMPEGEGLASALRPELLTFFKPAFLGRVTLVPYLPLGPEVISAIVKINLDQMRDRIQGNYGANLVWGGGVIAAIAERCTESQSGARNIENIVRRQIQPTLAQEFLQMLSEGKSAEEVILDIDSSGSFTYEFR